jgi:hypothetical protein
MRPVFDPADQVANSKSFGRDSPDSPFAFLATGPWLLTFYGVLLLSGCAGLFGFFRLRSFFKEPFSENGPSEFFPCAERRAPQHRRPNLK